MYIYKEIEIEIVIERETRSPMEPLALIPPMYW